MGVPSVLAYTRSNTVTKGANYENWKQRLRDGQQCTTAMSGTLWSRKSAGLVSFLASYKPPPPFDNCVLYPHVSGESGYFWGVHIDTVNIGTDPSFRPTEEQVDNLAKVKFVKRIREQQTTFQGGVAAGEVNETLRMLSSPVKSLRKGLSSYLATLKKRKRQVKRVSPRKRLNAARKVLSDTWLEYSFGWKPLIHDIDDAMKTLANSYHSDERSWVPINAKHIEKYFQPRSLTVGIGGGIVTGLSCQAERRQGIEVIYRGSVSLGNPTQRAWKAGNFTNDFIPTVWELIPYSFLVDYFTNIGDVISAATLFQSNLRWSSRTTVETRECEVFSAQATFASSQGMSGFSYGKMKEHQIRKDFSRAPYTGSLVPSVQFTLPNTVTKWLNIAALASSQRALVPFYR